MKVSFKYYILAASIVLGMTSCDDYLDKMPDNRTELDETSKFRICWCHAIQPHIMQL